MDSLKTHKKKSRVKQFYSDFNSDSSTSSSSEDEGPQVFTFQKRPRAPVLRPNTPDSPVQNWSSNTSSYSFGARSRAILSPGLSRNQDIKDAALDSVFKRRIDDLKSSDIFKG